MLPPRPLKLIVSHHAQLSNFVQGKAYESDGSLYAWKAA